MVQTKLPFHLQICWQWSQKLWCHTLDLFEHQISTVEGDGEKFNTLRINFEADGGSNSLLHFKHDQNGANQDVM